MIDLHMHTKYSDGTWSVEETLRKAQKIGLNTISITDHDSVAAHRELAENDAYKSIFTGKIIPGVEFSTSYDGVAVHMLAYDFDYTKLEDFLEKRYHQNKPDIDLEFKMMYDNCIKNGVKLDKIEFDINNGWPVKHIYGNLKEHPENKRLFGEEEWNDEHKFFYSCITNKEFPAYIDFGIHYPRAEEIRKVVTEAGGKLFLAHLYRYNLKDNKEFLDKLAKNKIIDGIEVYHSSFTNEQSENLLKYCTDNNILMSGGSDCHGDKYIDRQLGIGKGNMKIEDKILNDWGIL